MRHMYGSACITRSHASMLCGVLRRTRAASASRICGLTEPTTRVGDFVLQLENIGELAVVSLGPQMIAERRVDELPGHANAVRRFAHASFENVAHAQLPGDLTHVDRLRLCR